MPGNHPGRDTDLDNVDTHDSTTVCARVRAVLSAELDGEASAGDDTRWAHAHVARCPDCARWADRAARLDRLLRIGPAADPEPDLVDAVLSRVRLPRRGRWRTPLRVALLVVAIAQLGIGLVSLFGPLGMAAGMSTGMSMDMSMTVHMDHEEAAFNLAFGLGLLLVAWDGRRARGLIPVLTGFVLVLVVSSAVDLHDGEVTWSREATHLPILVGLLLSAAVARTSTGEPGPLSRWLRWPGSSVRRSGDTGWSDAPPAAAADRRPPRPAARRDVA